MVKKIKFDKTIIISSLPYAVELAGAVIILIAVGYLVGGLFNEIAKALGMFMGATLGLIYFLYRTTKRFSKQQDP
ncbi:MAG: hypothetical protein B6U97_00705 [Candidatus Altiarchaeales archaeon ex4484_96]|nr:MAG: hypothetical protein B6U97_00705 [Candidatus Altiarchaeales archaeon ex4484_96]